MKFAEHLFENSVSEWRKQYIQYTEMKSLIHSALKRNRQSTTLSQDSSGQVVVDGGSYWTSFEDQFFHFCHTELDKIEAFYMEKLTQAQTKLTNLEGELDRGQPESQSKIFSARRFRPHKRPVLQDVDINANQLPPVGLEKEKKQRKKQILADLNLVKLAFSEFYLSLIHLKNYQDLNYTGYRKILKKYDKNVTTTNGAGWFQEKIEPAQFHTNNQVDLLIKRTEEMVTNRLEGGNRPRAMKRLRVVHQTPEHRHWTTFKLGLFSGAFTVLLIFTLLATIFDHTNDLDWLLVFRLYRAPFLIAVYTFLLGVNVYGWRSTGVNHVLIFELDHRNHLTQYQLMEFATFIGVFWAASLFYTVNSKSIDDNPPLNFSPYANPVALLILLLILFLVNPTKSFSHQSRFWIVSVLGRIMAAPFFEVKFPDFWLADQLNSLSQVLLDVQHSVCLYATFEGDFSPATTDSTLCRTDDSWSIWIRAFLSGLPAWFRFMQCLRRYRDSHQAFPHLANAAKYSTTFFVVIFSTLRLIYEGSQYGPFFVLWTIARVVSSTYGLVWDIRMDWGLCEKSCANGKITFLRAERVYPFRVGYYLATVQDVILRFKWIPLHFLVTCGHLRGDTMVSISAVLEIWRRFVWNFFRLENEHVNNCGQFRAVRDISLAHLTRPRGGGSSGGGGNYRRRISTVFGLA